MTLKINLVVPHLFEKELIPDILSFLTVTLGHFFFKKDLHLAPVFTNQTKSKEDFPLLQKMVESENTFSICFAAAFTEAAHTLQWAAPLFLWEPQHQAP